VVKLGRDRLTIEHMREWRGSYSVLWERGDGNRQSEMKYVEMQEEIILHWILMKWNWVIEWMMWQNLQIKKKHVHL
jgi:hypothetical protein